MGAPNDFEAFSRATLDDDLKKVVKRAVESGFAIVLNKPGTNHPACTLPPTQRGKAHDCGIYHAITEPGSRIGPSAAPKINTGNGSISVSIPGSPDWP